MHKVGSTCAWTLNGPGIVRNVMRAAKRQAKVGAAALRAARSIAILSVLLSLTLVLRLRRLTDH